MQKQCKDLISVI